MSPQINVSLETQFFRGKYNYMPNKKKEQLTVLKEFDNSLFISRLVRYKKMILVPV